MAEFNYGINIPPPNTGMFGGNLIQSLSAIEGIRAAKAQQELAATLAPYQLQEAQLGIKAREQQIANSAAAAARAARGEALQLRAAESEFARREKVATAMNQFATDETTGADALAPIIGLTNENERKALTDAARIRTGRLFKKMDPNNPDPESIQQIAELNALLPVEEAKRFDNILAAMPNKYRDGVVNTIVEASMFGLAKDNGRAFGVLKDQIEALNKDPNPVSKRMAKELEDVVNRLPEDAPPAIWANIGYMNQSKTDPKKAEGFLNFLKERAPEALAEKEAGTAKLQAEAELKNIEAQMAKEGTVSPKEKQTAENQLRENFNANPIVKNYVLRQDFVSSVQAAKELNSIPGDASAIVSAVKINDPTSTVSIAESGQITGGTIPAAFRSLVAKVNSGGKLSEKDRDDLIKMAERRMKDSEKQYNTFREKTAAVAKRNGLNIDNIFVIPDQPVQSVLKSKTKAPTEASAPSSAGSGWNLTTPNGMKVDIIQK